MASKEEWIREFGEIASQLRVGDLEFSGSTYQVQVFEGEEEFWPFLQFDGSGEVGDCFCSCEAADREGSCPHLAAALLHIYGDHAEPLHIRFRESLWNVLCRILSDQQGGEPSGLFHEEPLYGVRTPSGKIPFKVEGKSEQVSRQLEAMIIKRVKETEENSIKFSGLSFEELALWREGRPSEALRYELSFWSDLAKWLFLLQERGEPYEIIFETNGSGLPIGLTVAFEIIEATFYLSHANLPHIIPALATVSSPLKVLQFQEEAIALVRFDPEAGSLHVEPKDGVVEGPLPDEGRAIEVGEWLFVEGEGFYSREQHALLSRQTIPAEEVSDVLDAHHKAISRHLDGVHREPLPLHYHLTFDPDWNLHIIAYLFELGDFQGGGGRYFGNWAYLEEDGFYRLDNRLFDEVETVIPAAGVSAFIHRHRIWLGTMAGFHPRLKTVESQLVYEVSAEGLHFKSRPGSLAEELGNHDFGDWVYVAGQGFYSKTSSRGSSRLAAGQQVGLEEIPFFIRAHREDLELIEGFFTEVCPVVRGVLSLKVVSKDVVETGCDYPLYPEYRGKEVQIFGEWVYTEGEGFCAIPKERLLPEAFREKRRLKGEELTLFLEYELAGLLPHIEELDPGLRRPTDLKLIAADTEGPMAEGLVQLTLHYKSGFGRVRAADVYRVVGQGRPFMMSEAGLLDLRKGRFGWLQSLPPNRVSHRTGAITLSTLELVRLSGTEDLQAEEGSRSEELIASILSLTPPSPPNLEGLESTLRPYQEGGVSWLWFLYSTGLSGLLCDDMGLGKTHQAMGLLAAISNGSKERPLFLVVCPTSVIYHWEEKLAAFLPGLKVVTYYGPARQMPDLEQTDLILTTYGIVRGDSEKLGKLSFTATFFDEIQVAKNPGSQTHKSLSRLSSRMKLGLTGTPIENSLRELKALFDLVLPTYFPTEAGFREQFVIPIEREGDPEAKRKLKQLVRPFILRRKKQEVLTELPEKTEERAHCELSQDQRQLYDSLLASSGQQLIDELRDEGRSVSYLHVFALLTHLKQVCDHPAVHHDEPSRYKEYASGKWSLFVELLNQARESAQKVVVFSQYLSMLDIIELYLKENGIGYAGIRGQTVRRDRQLKRFAEDPRCEVFVGSLQASGVGIDLTAASVVIHYDRWWNAARENQATDRVHRIGQTRGVQVFKLVTKDTIEERIDELITIKGALMEEVVSADEQSQLKALSRDELISLLTL